MDTIIGQISIDEIAGLEAGRPSAIAALAQFLDIEVGEVPSDVDFYLNQGMLVFIRPNLLVTA